MIVGKARAHKYNAKRTEVDGITFASKAEAKRYAELKMLERAGEILRLVLQPRFDLTTNGKKIGEYRADFAYMDRAGNHIVEDVKGFCTALYRWKKKHMLAEHGVVIREVR